jgi:hypothetical protein
MRAIFLSLLCLLITACAADLPVVENPAGTPATTGTRSPLLFDAGNTLLGYASANAYGLQVTSMTGWFYSLGWDGQLSDSFCYFTGTAGTGTPFLLWASSPPFAKTIVAVGSSVLTFQDVDSYGNAQSDPAIASYQSYSSAGSIVSLATPQDVAPPNRAYPLASSSRAAAGIPASIMPPLRLQYSP